MAVKFQYNKVSMQSLQKALKIREAALPTLKSKEAYLRITIKKERHRLAELQAALEERRSGVGKAERLFAEFPAGRLDIHSVEYDWDNIAGISIPSLKAMYFSTSGPSAVMEPAWMGWGVETLEALARATAEIDVAHRRIDLLEYARKKTTQKVNLYEKVQIPEFAEAILKIKRYLEDVENLGKAAQKITKERQAAAAGAA